MQPGQQYDRASTVFSPDGRLFQVEYAREAVKRGTTAVGLKAEDGVVLIVEKRIPSDLLEPGSIGKIVRLSERVGCASSGLVADARALVDRARLTAQVDEMTYGEPIDVPTLVGRLCTEMQARTQYGGMRPFGTALLIAGADDEGFHLYETDPSGASVAYEATGIGQNRSAVMEILEAEYEPEMDRDAAIGLGIDAIGRAAEAPIDADRLEVGVADPDERFRTLDVDEIAEHVDGVSDETPDEGE